MIHVVLAHAAPTEADARLLLTAEDGYTPDTPYHGMWVLPAPLTASVHVFGSCTPAELTANHWTREDE